MLIGSMLLLINCDMAQAADTTSVSADSMLLFENEIDNLGKETDNKKEEKQQYNVSLKERLEKKKEKIAIKQLKEKPEMENFKGQQREI